MEEEKSSQSFEHDITKANNNYIGWTWRRDRYIWFLTALMHMLLVGDAVKDVTAVLPTNCGQTIQGYGENNQ